MKRSLFKKFVLGVVAASIMCVSCKNETQDSVPQLFEENPTTISWDMSKSDSIDTFSAIVSVYEDSNRRTGGAKLQNQYKMTVKTTDDKQYVRLDFPSSANTSAKSVLTNGIDTILVDTATNEIEQKFTASDLEMKLINDLGYIISHHTLSKVNLSRIKTECAKLSLDMNEAKEEGVLSVELPSKYFSSEKEKRISTKVSYDIANELMESVETVTETEDGTTLTVTTCPVYEEIENGQIIKIGQYSIIDKKYTVRFEGLEDLEYFDSLESIPEISKEEYEQLVEEGNAEIIEELPLGDPSDPGSVETIIELYQDIQINVADDSVFKLIMEF